MSGTPVERGNIIQKMDSLTAKMARCNSCSERKLLVFVEFSMESMAAQCPDRR